MYYKEMIQKKLVYVNHRKKMCCSSLVEVLCFRFSKFI